MVDFGIWLETELPADAIEEWRAAGATPEAALVLDEAGWTPRMGALGLAFRGKTMTIASAVALGLSLDEAELCLARVPGYPATAVGL
jgi:hypothetical protein